MCGVHAWSTSSLSRRHPSPPPPAGHGFARLSKRPRPCLTRSRPLPPAHANPPSPYPPLFLPAFRPKLVLTAVPQPRPPRHADPGTAVMTATAFYLDAHLLPDDFIISSVLVAPSDVSPRSRVHTRRVPVSRHRALRLDSATSVARSLFTRVSRPSRPRDRRRRPRVLAASAVVSDGIRINFFFFFYRRTNVLDGRARLIDLSFPIGNRSVRSRPIRT